MPLRSVRATHGGAEVPDVVSPPPGNPRFPLLDALRALAALSIVLAHVLLYCGLTGTRVPVLLRPLGTGVTIFFTLSGFLLYRPFVAAHTRRSFGPRPDDYVKRRLLRIFPPLWLALAVLMLYPGLGPGTDEHWWVYSGLLQNWIVAPVGLPQAWSLSVEVAFYVVLLLPALAGWLLVGRISRDRPLRGELLLLGLLLGIWIAWQAHPIGEIATPVYYLDWFLTGMALAVASVAVQGRERTPAVIKGLEAHPGVCWLAALAIYVVLGFHPAGVSTLRYHVAQGVIALLIVTPAVFAGQTRLHRVLAWRALGWLGLISYGIYLWHATIVEQLAHSTLRSLPMFPRILVVGGIAVAITVACAAISYYALERPLLRRKYRRRKLPAAAPAYGLVGAAGDAADRNQVERVV